MSDNIFSGSKLTDEQLSALVKKGNDKAFEVLAVRYLRNIIFIARKYSAQGYEQNDFVQEGLLGLLYACNTFDKNGDASFKSYVDIIVERRFISIVRKSNAQKVIPDKNLVSIDEDVNNISDGTQNPEERYLFREQLSSVLSDLKKLLSENEYKVLVLYCSGLSYKQIGIKLGISPKSADNSLQRARRKICSHNMSLED